MGKGLNQNNMVTIGFQTNCVFISLIPKRTIGFELIQLVLQPVCLPTTHSLVFAHGEPW